MTVQKGGWDRFQEEGRHVGFTPSSYSATITIVAGTIQTGALASGVKKVMFANTSATTVDALVAFGESSTDAETNLGLAAGAGTTGYWVPASIDSAAGVVTLGVPVNATHYAVINDTAAETPTVRVIQGV